MEGLDHWLLADEFSVIQAALLISGVDPAIYQEQIESLRPEKRPKGFDATKAALSHAISAGRLRATICDRTWNRGFTESPNEPDWAKTTVTRDHLVAWLKTRGFTRGFFFPAASNVPDYLDPNHPNYAPKLAAAVC